MPGGISDTSFCICVEPKAQLSPYISVDILTESLDPLDIEDYLAEILSNEFNVIIQDGSLAKV